MKTPKQLCTFIVNGFYFGIDVLKVQEVIRYQLMTRVPTAPAMVMGLINLRGQIVIAVDMRQRMDFPTKTGEDLPLNIVVHCEDGAVSLLVDEIGDVIEVDENAFELPLENLNGVARELVAGIYKLPERLLLLLDVDKAVSVNSTSVNSNMVFA